MPTAPKHPLSFEEERERAGATTQIPLGVRPVRVKRIMGSAGKADKVGLNFRPLGRGPADAHFQDILRRMKAGEDLPEITLYQIGPRYFVVDGHTRVAAAKQLGIEFLDADVTEFLPRKEGEVNLTYYARRDFERNTGLEGVRLTAAWRYHLLQHHIEGYRLYLERSREREVSLPEAARVWYRTQYLPTLRELRRRKLPSSSGGHTAGDVYTDILKAWAEEQGPAVSLREMLDRYDLEAQKGESTLTRARRRVTEVVDAALPKAVQPISAPDAGELAEEDVEAELRTLEEPAKGT
jgi:hypothetical protein